MVMINHWPIAQTTNPNWIFFFHWQTIIGLNFFSFFFSLRIQNEFHGYRKWMSRNSPINPNDGGWYHLRFGLFFVLCCFGRWIHHCICFVAKYRSHLNGIYSFIVSMTNAINKHKCDSFCLFFLFHFLFSLIAFMLIKFFLISTHTHQPHTHTLIDFDNKYCSFLFLCNGIAYGKNRDYHVTGKKEWNAIKLELQPFGKWN